MLTKKVILIIILKLISNCVEIKSLDNGLCLRPPMGWLSWERFGCNTKCDHNSNDCIRSLTQEVLKSKIIN
jgi:hypothetical protein